MARENIEFVLTRLVAGFLNDIKIIKKIFNNNKYGTRLKKLK
jgi:hypothetical protein